MMQQFKVGEEELVKERRGTASAIELGLPDKRGMQGLWRKGAPGIKKPPAGHKLPEGVSRHTRRIETHPHGALRSREAYPLQRSSLQGLLPHRSSYQEAMGLHMHYYPSYMSHRRQVVKRIDRNYSPHRAADHDKGG
jgi:hypothetical protein